MTKVSSVPIARSLESAFPYVVQRANALAVRQGRRRPDAVSRLLVLPDVKHSPVRAIAETLASLTWSFWVGQTL